MSMKAIIHYPYRDDTENLLHTLSLFRFEKTVDYIHNLHIDDNGQQELIQKVKEEIEKNLPNK